MERRALLIGLCAWTSGRAMGEPKGPRRKEPWIRLERSACYGTCPVFSLEVFLDGEVTFDGRRCVMRKGRFRRRLAATHLSQLKAAVDDSSFWNLAMDCCSCRELTDHPWTVIEITKGDAEKTTKTIKHYHGCTSAPRVVPMLEDAIISATDATKWIGTFEERDRQKWTRSRC
jgi:hypothetical protein